MHSGVYKIYWSSSKYTLMPASILDWNNRHTSGSSQHLLLLNGWQRAVIYPVIMYSTVEHLHGLALSSLILKSPVLTTLNQNSPKIKILSAGTKLSNLMHTNCQVTIIIKNITSQDVLQDTEIQFNIYSIYKMWNRTIPILQILPERKYYDSNAHKPY